VTLLSCVFQSNTFDYFVGTSPDLTVNITFINCVFDVQSLNATNAVSFSTTGCTYKTQPTSLTDCRTRTPVPTATRSQTSSFTVAWDVLTRRRRRFLQLGLFTLAMTCR
jgi:hypothetical protein